MIKHWIWKAAIAGFCGSAAHTLLMYLKSRFDLLPAFQPYESLQGALGHMIGGQIHPAIPWAISYLNGSTILGPAFGWIYPRLPGNSGAAKGLVFGVLGWMLMGIVFFPLLRLGFFATGVGLGIKPALFSLAMVLTYSIILGIVYAALNSWPPPQTGEKLKRRPGLGGV
ncbi:DUF6789 family protein [Bradyrhizobium sp. USDA 10063]